MKQPHLKIKPSDISPYVLLPGDPERVDLIGEFLTDFQIISQNREYKIGTGMYKNKKITICSTGIGCPSTAIAVEELINANAKYLIRVGTCGGSWRNDVPAGSIIIPTASVRDEGTTKEYIGKEFPAVADFQIIQALYKSAKKENIKYFTGINRTHDAFYGTQSSVKKWGSYLLDKRWQKYNTPILSSEMESSALFIIASLRNVKAGAIFAVNAEPESLRDRILEKNQEVKTQSNQNITDKTVKSMIRIALNSIVQL